MLAEESKWKKLGERLFSIKGMSISMLVLFLCAVVITVLSLQKQQLYNSKAQTPGISVGGRVLPHFPKKIVHNPLSFTLSDGSTS